MKGKGKYLEGQIDKLIDTVIRSGFWGQKNHPQRLYDGTYVKGEPFDYYIFTTQTTWFAEIAIRRTRSFGFMISS